MNTNFYLGKQRPEPGAADRLGRTDVGWKEDTGFTTNNDRFVQQADNPVRFVTHYDTRSVDSCSPQAGAAAALCGRGRLFMEHHTKKF